MYIKLIETDPRSRPRRERVSILKNATNEIVTYPNGRTRWFGSEEEADDWIRAAAKNPPPPECLRLWKWKASA